MMGKSKLVAIALAVALAACAKDADNDQAAADSAAAAPAADNTAAAPAPAPAAPASLPEGATADMVAQGQQIFTSTGNCFTCHGADAKGTALAPNLTDAEWLNITGKYDEIQGIVKNGVPQPKSHPAPMPAMGGAQLSDDQVKQVAAYVWSLGGGK
jgi:cbb3-type cytochrome c oxidase subunit III